jgi:response regulator RpfG family c-di-GMP phosphodiesterase
MNRKVLCVDDEENVLRAFERNLRLQFEIETAIGPVAGLSAIAQRGPYAVVISDLRMPEMDGIQFLSAVRKQSPDSVRLILSGNADLQAVIASVNEGSIFQFLTKPCPVDTLRSAIDGALKQYQLILAERELLEHTLNGSVAMMTEVLSVVSPLAFSRASRIRGHIRHMATQLELPNLWEFDLASMLSQIGCIAVPSDILEKIYTGTSLTAEEQKTFASHPSVGQKLLAKIPRLEVIADIIGYQMTPFRELRDLKISEVVKVGAQMLMVAIRFDEAVSRGASPESAVKFMSERPEIFQPNLTTAIGSASVGALEMEVRTIRLRDLRPNMIINEDLWAANGLLLVAKGQLVSEPVIARLLNFSKFAGIDRTFSIRVPVARTVVIEPVPMTSPSRLSA